MSDTRTEAIVQESMGGVRESWGQLTGRPSTQIRGHVEEVVGHAKQFVAGISESVGDAVRQIRDDRSLENPDTRKAALKLLAYIAGALLVVNAIARAPRIR